MAQKRILPLLGINYSDSEGSDNEVDASMDAIIVEKKLKYEDIFGKERLTIAQYTDSVFGKDRSEFVIPYPSKHPCKAELQAQTNRFLEKVQNGFDITRSFETKREVRNPELYGKMVSHFKIDDFGTNFTPRFQYGAEYLDDGNFYDKLAAEQNTAMEKLQSHAKKSASGSSSANNTGHEQSTKRKTKWDSTSSTVTSSSSSSRPATSTTVITSTVSTSTMGDVVVTKLSGIKSSSKRH